MTPSPPLFHTRWLVSARYDLSFFIGSGLLTFAFLGLYLGLSGAGWAPSGVAVLVTYGLFTILLDLPHIFQTFSRTHADPVEFQRRKGLYTWGLPLFMLSGLLIPLLGIDAYFIAFMALYGSHHIVRQHLGFLRIYQGLNEKTNPWDRWIDRLALEISLYACILHDYLATTAGKKFETVTVYGNLKAYFPAFPEELGTLMGILAVLALLVFVGRQGQLFLKGQPLNLPKLLLMLMVLTSHYVVFVIAAVPFLVGEAIETAYHDVQYHGFVAHYQRHRFPHQRRIALRWLGLALLYGLVAGSIEVLGFLHPLFYWVFLPLGMLTLFHYYIDGKIWRLRDCPELRAVVFVRPGYNESTSVAGAPLGTL